MKISLLKNFNVTTYRKASMASLCFSFLLMFGNTYSQRIPNESENIDYVMTFGEAAPTTMGDDDHVQIFFFMVPMSHDQSIFIRIFDADTGGDHDELKNVANTKTRISLYGGKGSFSNEDARKTNPVGAYKSGTILFTKIFGNEVEYNSKWYSFGPINPIEGEQVTELKSYVFKVVIAGVSGDDGNAYRLFLSSNSLKNVPVDGANSFTYEYTFKAPLSKTIVHIYPFIDNTVSSITQYNFDGDNLGNMFLYSVAKNRHESKYSGDNEWISDKHKIEPMERNTTLDIQLLTKNASANTMSLYVLNQYDVAIAFFSTPIGGPPKFKYDPTVVFKKGTK